MYAETWSWRFGSNSSGTGSPFSSCTACSSICMYSSKPTASMWPDCSLPNRLPPPRISRSAAAIQEFTELGSGFRIAAADLEIRGGGNLLGKDQSGHIAAGGFELDTQMLEQDGRG